MPRSYREWMKAKNKWTWEQAERTRSITIPEDPILYIRESTNDYWTRRRDPFLEAFPHSTTLQFQVDKVKEFMNQAADAEEAKEIAFLQQFYTKFNKVEKGESIIDQFNNLFQSRELYQEFNERLKTALNTSKKSVAKEDQKTGPGMAPNFYSVFTSYFMNKLEQETIPAFYKSINPNKDDAESLEKKFEAMLQETVRLAAEHIVYKAGFNDDGTMKDTAQTRHFGIGNEFIPILEMLQDTTSDAKAEFARNMREAIGLSAMEELKQEIYDLKANKIKKYGFKKLIAEKLGNVRGQTAQVGGSIAEIGATTIVNRLAQGLENFSMSGMQFGGSTVVTDMVYMFHTEANINLQPLLDEMRVAMTSGSSERMREVYKRLEAVQKKWEHEGKDLDKLYNVFVNAKNYDVRAGAYNYTKEYHGKVEELPEFFNSMGIDVSDPHDFLWLVYNTGYVAVGNQLRGTVEEEIVAALKAAAAKVMFDDYQEIGKQDSHNIHLYFLSGKYIPSSVILREAAKAVDSARERTRASIQLPNPIDDHGPEWPEIRANSKSNADFKEKLLDHWKKEIETAKTESTWSLEFTLAIRQILLGNK